MSIKGHYPTDKVLYPKRFSFVGPRPSAEEALSLFDALGSSNATFRAVGGRLKVCFLTFAVWPHVQIEATVEK